MTRRRLPARALFLAPLLGALLAGCGGGSGPPERAPTPFDYDAKAPLAYRDGGRVNRDYPVEVRDVSYRSGRDTIPAFLVEPVGRKHLPAVVYVHGSGGDRTDLLVPATFLAGRGAVALLIREPSAGARQPAGLDPAAALRWQRDLAVRDVVAVRRAVDLLDTLPSVDPEHVGYVGWSLGARTGAIAAGVAPRLKALVLRSGGAPPVADYLAQAPAALRPKLRPLLRDVDPLRWIARAHPGSLLLQDGRRDEVVPQAALEGLAAAAPKRTDVRWYRAGHALDLAAFRDQLAWLTERLPIRGPAVPGARTAP